MTITVKKKKCGIIPVNSPWWITPFFSWQQCLYFKLDSIEYISSDIIAKFNQSGFKILKNPITKQKYRIIFRCCRFWILILSVLILHVFTIGWRNICKDTYSLKLKSFQVIFYISISYNSSFITFLR